MQYDLLPDLLAIGLLLAAAVLVVVASRRSRLADAERLDAERTRLALEVETRRRQSVLRLHERALAGAGLGALGRDAAQAVTDAIAVPYCAVLEIKPEGQTLRLSASAGWDATALEEFEIDAHIDLQVGYALVTREPVVVVDAETEHRFVVPSELRTRGLRSSIAVRIGSKQVHGVLVAGAAAPQTFDDGAVQFVCSVAAILAAAFDRRRLEDERAELIARDEIRREAAQLATRRAAFLAQTATVLDAALDPDATLVSLARLAVPAVADCAVVDHVDQDGRIHRIEVVDIDPIKRQDAETLRRLAPDLRREGPFARAIRTGQPVLLTDTAKVTDARGDAEQLRVLARLGCQSLVLIPLVARGQTLGLLTLGSRLHQRYDSADLSLAQELAGRAAIALDNGRLHREAEAASHAKDEFLATVSHELRTPLHAVLGWSALLRTQLKDEGRAPQALDAIERSVRAQARLLEQLLDVSRIVSGTFELRLTSVRLQEAIEAAEAVVRPTADDRRIAIHLQLDHDVPPIVGDPSRLEQVIVNLLSNAVKFSQDDGLVEVELRRADGTAEMLVRDHGVGISREFLPHVFERFRQSPQAGPNHGLGLGLSIVRDIVEKHGGAVTAESAGEGQGATFRVLLPLGAPAEVVNS